MKKTYVNFASILVAALCLAFTACNGMTNSGETGTVQVFIGGGAARAVGGNGLPMFDGTNTTITVTDEDGELLAQGATSVVLNVAIGTKITVKAVVTTATGKWRDSETHTVKPGVNNIDLKLSKTPKVAANLLFSMKKDLSGSTLLSLNTANGTPLLNGISDNPKPVTARDKIGRVYVLYKDGNSGASLKRFNVEGIEDTAFSANFANALTAASISISAIDNIAIDQDDNYIFLFKQNTVYCFKEKDDHSFESFSSDGFSTVPASTKASAVAVGDKVLFAVYGQTLYACKFEFQDLPTPGNKVFKFKSSTIVSKPLDKLRKNASLFGNDLPECTGLFADDDEVYCLLTQQKYEAGKKYALGQLVRYEYSGSGSGSTLTKKGETGLNPAASTGDPIAFNAQYFSNPIGFIGYDEENIYIADDGVNIGYINENWRIKGNKNRIAAFNRKTKTLTFSDTGATWYDEKPKYPSGTKTLLWGKDGNQEFRYWIGEDGTETFSEGNKLFASGSAKKPTDVFCYDQDGNLYILWKDSSSSYRVRRFALKEDGSYNTQGMDTSSLTFFDISAIAVDISDGQNILYYAYKDTNLSASAGSSGHIKKYSWVLGAAFSTGSVDNSYDVTFDANNEPVTALAANKDGLFAGVKETYQNVSTVWQYRLKIKKYKKSNVTADSELVLVNQAPVDTDLSGNPIDNTFTGNIRIQYGESINALQVFDGILYALSSKSREIQKQGGIPYYTDAFKSSGKLYKIGNTNDTLSGNAVVLAKKDWNDANKIGYGFYRFIAVKYDEAERIKFIIASDGAWDENGISGRVSSPKVANGNTDRVLEYDLKGNLQAEREAGGRFSKTLMIGSDFYWD